MFSISLLIFLFNFLVMCFLFFLLFFFLLCFFFFFFFFSSRRRHTRSLRDWSSDVCSSDLRLGIHRQPRERRARRGVPSSLRIRHHPDLRDHRPAAPGPGGADRKSTRLNSSHVEISYAVFCLKKKKKKKDTNNAFKSTPHAD